MADVYDSEEEKDISNKKQKAHASSLSEARLQGLKHFIQPLHFKEEEGGEAISLPTPPNLPWSNVQTNAHGGSNKGAKITKGRPLFPGQWSPRRCQGNLISWTSTPISWRFRFQHSYLQGKAQHKGKQTLPVPAYQKDSELRPFITFLLKVQTPPQYLVVYVTLPIDWNEML